MLFFSSWIINSTNTPSIETEKKQQISLLDTKTRVNPISTYRDATGVSIVGICRYTLQPPIQGANLQGNSPATKNKGSLLSHHLRPKLLSILLNTLYFQWNITNVIEISLAKNINSHNSNFKDSMTLQLKLNPNSPPMCKNLSVSILMENYPSIPPHFWC